MEYTDVGLTANVWFSVWTLQDKTSKIPNVTLFGNTNHTMRPVAVSLDETTDDRYSYTCFFARDKRPISLPVAAACHERTVYVHIRVRCTETQEVLVEKEFRLHRTRSSDAAVVWEKSHHLYIDPSHVTFSFSLGRNIPTTPTPQVRRVPTMTPSKRASLFPESSPKDNAQ